MIREFEVFGKELQIEQDLNIVNKEAGSVVWDGAFVLAKYFENANKWPLSFFKDKKVLELGAGTGIIGIVLLLLGAEVHFTDKDVLLPLIQYNIEQNAPHISKDKYQVKELMWGETEVSDKYDIIVACDCVYESQDMWMPLATCLNQIATDETDVIMSYELRSKKDAAFFPHISKTFTIRKVLNTDLDEFWQSPDIGVFHLRKRQEPKEDVETESPLGDLRKRERHIDTLF